MQVTSNMSITGHSKVSIAGHSKVSIAGNSKMSIADWVYIQTIQCMCNQCNLCNRLQKTIPWKTVLISSLMWRHSVIESKPPADNTYIAHSLNVPHSTPAVGHQSSYHFYTYALLSKVLEALKAGAQVLTRADRDIGSTRGNRKNKEEKSRRKRKAKERRKSERLKNRKRLKKRPRKNSVKVQSLVFTSQWKAGIATS